MLNFEQDDTYEFICILFYEGIQFQQYDLLKTLSFFTSNFWPLCKTANASSYVELCSGHPIPLVIMSVYMPMQYCFYFYNSVI